MIVKKGGLRTKGILKTNPLITTITVVFNNEKYIEDCIKSVIKQTYNENEREYIIIDGGSTDRTLEIIKKYEDKIDYWQSEKDEGFFHGVNKGLEFANGKWIHFLNSDDYYYENETLEKVAKILDDSGKYFYYFTLIQDYGKFQKKFKNYFNFLTKIKMFYSSYIPQPTLFVMKKQYEEVGYYNYKDFPLAADDEMVFRLIKKYKPKFFDIPVTVMRQLPESYANKNFFKNFWYFKKLVTKEGLPSFLAEIFFRIKIWRHKKIFLENYFNKE